jgi:KDO2-lipid IV(A) lauroyltransferase
MKRLSHFIEYAALRTLEFLIGCMPRSFALWLGGCVGLLLYRLGVYRKIVKKNMDFVNLWGEPEKRRITRRLYWTMGRYFSDILRPSMHQPPAEIHNAEIMDRHLAQGRGIFVLLAHFGNWEALAAIFGKRVSNLHVIALPMHNPLVQKWLAARRAATGVTTLYAKSALRGSIRALRRNGILAVLVDQFARKEGQPAPFLGKTARTYRTMAGIVYNTRCAVQPTYALLREDGIYDVMISEAPYDHLPASTADEFITACQAQHNEIISAWIRQYPDHWFGWFHKRFRDQIRY